LAIFTKRVTTCKKNSKNEEKYGNSHPVEILILQFLDIKIFRQNRKNCEILYH